MLPNLSNLAIGVNVQRPHVDPERLLEMVPYFVPDRARPGDDEEGMFASWSSLEDDDTVPPIEGGGTVPADDGTVPAETVPAETVSVETVPANERGGTQPPSPAPDSSVQVYKESVQAYTEPVQAYTEPVQAYREFRVDLFSNRQLRYQAEGNEFFEMWNSGRWFFKARTESDEFPLKGFIGKSDSYDTHTMEMAWVVASGSAPSNLGTYNTFVRLEGSARTDIGKRIWYDGEFGVRYNSLSMGHNEKKKQKKKQDSATEAFVTLWAASVGIGPRVLLSGMYEDRGVYLLVAHTPLSRVLKTKSMPVRGLDDALSRVIVKASLAGLLMLDTKPDDIVLDYDKASHSCKQAFIVDYDITFTALYDIAGGPRDTSVRCLFIINSVLFLLSWRQGCVDNLTRAKIKNEYEHYPIKTLVQRLRKAVAEAKADSETSKDVLCRVLNMSRFVDRTVPSSTRTSLIFNVSGRDDQGQVEVVARFIIYLADYFGHFGGGDPVFCPIPGLKLDEAIWPQLVDASINSKHFDQTIDKSEDVAAEAAKAV